MNAADAFVENFPHMDFTPPEKISACLASGRGDTDNSRGGVALLIKEVCDRRVKALESGSYGL